MRPLRDRIIDFMIGAMKEVFIEGRSIKDSSFGHDFMSAFAQEVGPNIDILYMAIVLILEYGKCETEWRYTELVEWMSELKRRPNTLPRLADNKSLKWNLFYALKLIPKAKECDTSKAEQKSSS